MRKRLRKKMARKEEHFQRLLLEAAEDPGFLERISLAWKLGRCPCHFIPIE
jgi:hypothetical protein